MTHSDKLSIDKKTGVSLGLILVLAPAIFIGISSWTRIQSQTERNSLDITGIFARLDDLNDNLIETNGNVIKLNSQLEALSVRQTAPSVIVARQPVYSVTITRGSALQPAATMQTQPEQQQSPPVSTITQEAPPVPASNPVQQALDNVLAIVRR